METASREVDAALGGAARAVDSEWSAAREAFAGPGTEPIRKWLGWALYRLAARVNPEIRD